MKYKPYTYLIGWSKYNLWYYGCRYSAKSNPEELWIKYFTSSKAVKKIRSEYGNPDVIQVRKIFDDEKSARMWEHKVLKRLKIKNNTKWLNQTDNLFPFYSKDRSYQKTKQWSEMMSKINKGREPWNKGRSNEKSKGTKFYNNGIEQRMFREDEIPNGWVKGRLNKPWNSTRKFSAESREKMSKSQKGKKRGPHSEETKRKMSESWAKRRERTSIQNRNLFECT